MSNELHGIKVCREAPTYYLFMIFFLFCRAHDKERTILKNILDPYGTNFGQAINDKKSEIFFKKYWKWKIPWPPLYHRKEEQDIGNVFPY